jgi:hypothetical protein
MARLTSVPPAALILGIAGLIPFLGFALLSAYGAVIASFLGGIRWGAAAARNSGSADYAIAILPSLIAWAALAAPAPWDLRILGILVLAWGFVDQDLPRRGLVPVWLGRLRLVLSGVAGASLLIAA